MTTENHYWDETRWFGVGLNYINLSAKQLVENSFLVEASGGVYSPNISETITADTLEHAVAYIQKLDYEWYDAHFAG